MKNTLLSLTASMGSGDCELDLCGANDADIEACRVIVETNPDDIDNVRDQIENQGLEDYEVVIIAACADDKNGQRVIEKLISEADKGLTLADYNQWRENHPDEVPTIFTFFDREYFVNTLDQVDSSAADFLRDIDGLAIAVLSRGIVAIFPL